jgi:hypothetical protein
VVSTDSYASISYVQQDARSVPVERTTGSNPCQNLLDVSVVLASMIDASAVSAFRRNRAPFVGEAAVHGMLPFVQSLRSLRRRSQAEQPGERALLRVRDLVRRLNLGSSLSGRVRRRHSSQVRVSPRCPFGSRFAQQRLDGVKTIFAVRAPGM